MTTGDAIETMDLTKKFGDFTAVDKVSFTVKKGEIFGFLGPNGAGKTTTIKMLCTLLSPTSGFAWVAGYDLIKKPQKVKENIGLVSDRVILYGQLTAAQNLRFFGNFYGINKQKMDRRIDELLAYVEMMKWKDKPVNKYSTGMRQRINIIRALLPEPRILFLDEPTLGLDPQTTLSIRNLIRDLRTNGTTVILTTHALKEAELLCDRIGIIDHGKIVVLDM